MCQLELIICRYEAEKKVLQEDFDKAKDTFDNLRDKLYKLTEQAKSQREAGKQILAMKNF